MALGFPVGTRIACAAVVLLGLMTALAGCTSGKTTILVPAAAGGATHSTLTLREGQFEGGEVSEENRGKLRAALSARLYGGGAFAEGPGLTLEYRIIQYDKGSRAARYWSSGLSGAGTLTLEALYFDGAGRQLAKCHFEGKVSSGGFGGDFKGAIDALASHVARYTIATFSSNPRAASYREDPSAAY